jgi:radical SAM superfamily enzyme YgiQ (UPF0313 family)
MKVKLICPRSTKRPMDSDWKTHMAPPLGLLVVGALTPPEHEVTLVDENVESLKLDDRPDVVGLSVKVDTVSRAAGIAAAYRRKGARVVVGGIHATACPDECLPLADAVVIGEAEEQWPGVLEDVARGTLKSVYRRDGPADLAASPIPRWNLLAGKDYLFTNTLTMSRGCPWQCEFCYKSAANVAPGYRMKPVPNILREIESLGTRHVMFIDDNFAGHPERARRLVRAMEPLGLTWHTAVSADIGRHGYLIEEMAAAGCRSLFIGFESVNGGSLAECGKHQNRIEEYQRTVRRIHASGMMVNASLVFGFDADGPDVFQNTLDWLVRNRIATMTAHILTPYPGTRLYQRLLAEGRILDTDRTRYNTAACVFRPKAMRPDELEAGHGWIYEQFYSWPNILRRWPAASSQVAAYLQFNLLYRKYGRLTCRVGRLAGMRNLARLAKALAYPEWARLCRPPTPVRERLDGSPAIPTCA